MAYTFKNSKKEPPTTVVEVLDEKDDLFDVSEVGENNVHIKEDTNHSFPIEDERSTTEADDQSDELESESRSMSEGRNKTDKASSCTCDICDKQLSSAARLRTHRNVHLDNDQRPFKCELCKKGFTDACALKRHELTHL
ncbi:hypothetical protein PMAYCL1PPCAC_22047, partial [Pristionchus mayeri]